MNCCPEPRHFRHFISPLIPRSVYKSPAHLYPENFSFCSMVGAGVEREFQVFERKGFLLTAGSCLRCWSFPGVRLQHDTELDCTFSFLAFSSPMPWIRLISGSWKSLRIMAHVRHFRTLVSGFYFWEATLLLRWVLLYLPVEELLKLVH